MPISFVYDTQFCDYDCHMKVLLDGAECSWPLRLPQIAKYTPGHMGRTFYTSDLALTWDDTRVYGQRFVDGHDMNEHSTISHHSHILRYFAQWLNPVEHTVYQYTACFFCFAASLFEHKIPRGPGVYLATWHHRNDYFSNIYISSDDIAIDDTNHPLLPVLIALTHDNIRYDISAVHLSYTLSTRLLGPLSSSRHVTLPMRLVSHGRFSSVSNEAIVLYCPMTAKPQSKETRPGDLSEIPPLTNQTV